MASFFKSFLVLFLALESFGQSFPILKVERQLEKLQEIDSPGNFLDFVLKQKPGLKTITLFDLSSNTDVSSTHYSNFKIKEIKEAAQYRGLKVEVIRLDKYPNLEGMKKSIRELADRLEKFQKEKKLEESHSVSLKKLRNYLTYIYETPTKMDVIRGLIFGGAFQAAITLFADSIRNDPSYPDYAYQTLVKSGFVAIYASLIGIFNTSYRKWLHISDTDTVYLLKTFAISIVFAATLLILDSGFSLLDSGFESIKTIGALSLFSLFLSESYRILEHSWLSQLAKRDLYRLGTDLENQGKISKLQSFMYSQVVVFGVYFFARLGHLLKIEAYHLDKGLLALFASGAFLISIRKLYLAGTKKTGFYYYSLGDVEQAEIILYDKAVDYMKEYYPALEISKHDRYKLLKLSKTQLYETAKAVPYDLYLISSFLLRPLVPFLKKVKSKSVARLNYCMDVFRNGAI